MKNLLIFGILGLLWTNSVHGQSSFGGYDPSDPHYVNCYETVTVKKVLGKKIQKKTYHCNNGCRKITTKAIMTSVFYAKEDGCEPCMVCYRKKKK